MGATTENTDNLAEYLKQINAIDPKLEHEKEVELLKRYKEAGDTEARNLVVCNNLKFVVYMVKSLFKHTSMDKMEIIAAGNEGLLKAIESFNPDLGVTLRSWAGDVIFTSAKRVIVKNKQMMTHGLYGFRSKVERMYEEISLTTLDRNEILEQINDRLNKEENKKGYYNIVEIDKALRYKEPMSINELIATDEQGVELIETIENPSALGMLDAVENRIVVSQLLEKLNEKEKYVVCRYYLDGDTFETIGKSLNSSRQYAQQIAVKAMTKMRNECSLLQIENVWG